MAALDFPTSPTTGQVYTANGKSWAYNGTSWVAQSGSPVAASFMGVLAFNSTTQSINTVTVTALAFDSESTTYGGYDTSAIHDTVTNNTRFTVPAGGAGYWTAIANIVWDSTTSGSRYMIWRKNGTTDLPGETKAAASVSSYQHQCVMPPLYLAAGDYVEITVYQDSGSARNVGSTLSAGSNNVSFYKVDGIVGGGTPSGTSFPATPGTGQQFFRTDLGLECYYDGTRWLTKHPLRADAYYPSSGTGFSALFTSSFLVSTDFSQSGVWLEKIVLHTYVGATNNGSNYWTVQAKSIAANGTLTNVGSSFTTAADTVDNYVAHTVTVNASIASTEKAITIAGAKTSSPGTIYVTPAFLTYRLIVT